MTPPDVHLADATVISVRNEQVGPPNRRLPRSVGESGRSRWTSIAQALGPPPATVLIIPLGVTLRTRLFEMIRDEQVARRDRLAIALGWESRADIAGRHHR